MRYNWLLVFGVLMLSVLMTMPLLYQVTQVSATLGVDVSGTWQTQDPFILHDMFQTHVIANVTVLFKMNITQIGSQVTIKLYVYPIKINRGEYYQDDWMYPPIKEVDSTWHFFWTYNGTIFGGNLDATFHISTDPNVPTALHLILLFIGNSATGRMTTTDYVYSNYQVIYPYVQSDADAIQLTRTSLTPGQNQLIFTEKGLPYNITWWVKLDGLLGKPRSANTANPNGNEITFNDVPEGQHSYTSGVYYSFNPDDWPLNLVYIANSSAPWTPIDTVNWNDYINIEGIAYATSLFPQWYGFSNYLGTVTVNSQTPSVSKDLNAQQISLSVSYEIMMGYSRPNGPVFLRTADVFYFPMKIQSTFDTLWSDYLIYQSGKWTVTATALITFSGFYGFGTQGPFTVQSNTLIFNVASSPPAILAIAQVNGNDFTIPIFYHDATSIGMVSGLEVRMQSGKIILSLSINGFEGGGAVTFIVPKSLVPTKYYPEAFVNGKPVVPTSQWREESNYYLVSFVIHFSTDNVTIQFSPVSASISNVMRKSLELTWTPALDPAEFNRYEIFMSITNGTLGTLIANITKAATTSLNVTDLSPSTTYYFTVKIWNIEGLYIQLAQVNTTTLTPPAAVTVSQSGVTWNSFNLMWTQSTDPFFAKYEIFQSKTSNSLGASIANITSRTITSYIINGLNQGTTYYFKVRVVCTEELYADSNQLSVTTFDLLLILIPLGLLIIIVLTFYFVRKRRKRFTKASSRLTIHPAPSTQPAQVPLPPQVITRVCPQCGHVLKKENMKFCSNCGKKME